MSLKRQRPTDHAIKPRARSSKRPKVNLELAQIWENLVDENEDIRLNAVYELLTVYCESDDSEGAKTIAKRLFRGLCSSRKNARQGFYVALVGGLSLKNKPFGSTEISLADIIWILDAQTTSEAGTSGQDERDHHFGRLLGCKALLESDALWASGNQFAQGWGRILDILSKLMAQKPWLRAEASIVICASIPNVLKICSTPDDVEPIIAHLFEKLINHKMLRTIDGVGIWLTVRQTIPTAKASEKIWPSGSPLHKNEFQDLKKILLGKRQSKEEEDLAGTSVWSPKSHPAWPRIIHQICQPQKHQVSFEAFWAEVIDQGFFDPESTPERKHTGFLVLGCALDMVAPSQLPQCLSKNLMACLVQALQSSDEAYLKKVISKVFVDYEVKSKVNLGAGSHELILALLQQSGYADFDVLTKSKIVSSLFEIKSLHQDTLSSHLLQLLQDDPGTEMPISKIAGKRKNVLNIFARAMCQAIRELTPEHNSSIEAPDPIWNVTRKMLSDLLIMREKALDKSRDMVEWDEGSYATLQEKISLMLEACLAAGSEGQKCFLQVIATLRKQVKLEAEDAIQDFLKASWTLFERIPADDIASSKEDSKAPSSQAQQGFKLLQALLLYEVYDGDEEAIGMLEDVTSMGDDFLAGRDMSKVADQILEIIISFISKPSRFRRRACGLIFEAFASHISSEGLESICRILTVKENKTGQLELFETGDDDISDDDSSAESGSIGSDVEIVSNDDGEEDADDSDDGSGMESASSDEEEDSDSDEGSETEAAGPDDQDDELAKFEGALAAALGTRKFNEDDMADGESDAAQDTTSDSDMSDSEMMALDDKLAEVFRNQQTQTSAQRLRKEEMKSAKENVINLKNRSIDLAEQFFRSQAGRGLECAKLLVSVMQLAESSHTAQLANRGVKLVKNYVQRNRGARMPKTECGVLVCEELWQHVKMLHDTVASKEASNSVIEAASQVNIFLCKLLLEAGEGEQELRDKMAAIADEEGMEAGVGMKRRAHEELWARYHDWIASVRGQPGRKSESGVDESKSGGKPGSLVVRGHTRKATRG